MPGPGKAVYGSVYLRIIQSDSYIKQHSLLFQKVFNFFNFIFSKYLASYFSKTIYNILIGIGPKGYYNYEALIRTQLLLFAKTSKQ